jgi:hypothetical protein
MPSINPSRSIAGLPIDASSEPYLDVQEGHINPLHGERLKTLKERLRTHLQSSRFLTYPENWLGHPASAVADLLNPEISHDNLPTFSRQVLDILTEQIQRKIAGLVDRTPAQSEQELHATFGAEACRVFAGRSTDRVRCQTDFLPLRSDTDR